MYVLVINAKLASLQFKVFKYSKKKNKARVVLKGQLLQIKTNPAILEIENLESNVTNKYTLNLDKKNIYLSAIKQLYSNDMFNQYSASIDYIINLLPYGSNAIDDHIIRLHEITIAELSKNNKGVTPIHQQQNNLQIAAFFLKLYPKCKHYACFDDAFYQTIPQANKIDSEYKNIISNSNGIASSYIAGNLSSFVDKKLSKGYWLVVHVGNSTSICGIKKGKSLLIQDIRAKSDKEINIWEDINNSIDKKDKLTQDLVEFYTLEIARYIAMYSTLLGDLDGIAFTGSMGNNMPKIRQMILAKLSWAGIVINRKSNNKNKLIISHKTSQSKILLVKADEELEMLNMLIKYKL